MSFVCTTVIAHIFNTCSYLFNFYCVSLKLVYPYKQIYKIISIEWETFLDYSFDEKNIEILILKAQLKNIYNVNSYGIREIVV